ncbi:MAG: cytochrome b/b6 domain-containing protein [Anaerolineales bacterium]|uniref:cytochrome b n=1 Tax=Candidatus Villigracilis vicinus TaxID=3140679 RepID=UPI00313495E4|nr:cytochrome b/b6 domain-containing protein [Anaerolineales bacterium]
MNTPKRYNPILVTLHWLTLIVMFGAGLLSEAGGDSPINFHMIFGVILLVIMIVRLITRFTTARPAPLDAGNAFFNKVGELTHIGLYGIAFFILGMGGLIAYNRNLFAYMMDSTAQVSRAGFVGAIHHLGWLLAMALIFLHVGAALYHQFILKDNILSRMWYGK